MPVSVCLSLCFSVSLSLCLSISLSLSLSFSLSLSLSLTVYLSLYLLISIYSVVRNKHRGTNKRRGRKLRVKKLNVEKNKPKGSNNLRGSIKYYTDQELRNKGLSALWCSTMRETST